ncbi:interferon-induced protein 44-like [Mercenaria mercenaria]|uniref:interferon-induced protein 44-like n=1 Tax=Mercenaria mercenaria TaxID=6596 RepID=UPI00234F7F6E|nr:interferon-induced protein 44-like [Mercenaria mercenaria]
MLLVKKIEVFHVIDDEYPEPWRTKLEDEHVEEIKKQLKEKKPIRGLGIKKYNVLLIGTIGVGKSSFYNTLATAFRDKVETFAPTGGSKGSVTNQIKAYTIEYEKDAELCVRIFDIRGFESQRGYEHELALILNGQLRIGYQFPDKLSKPAEEDICKTTTLDDQIHLLCFLTGPPENYNTAQIEEIDNILHITSVKGLPKVVVATKFDEQCLNITEDVDHLYKCKKSKETTEDIAKFFKIQENHVLPVVNYTSENVKSKGIERLALQALHKMIEVTECFLAKHKDKKTKPDAFEERKQLSKQQEIDVKVRQLWEEMAKFENETFRILCIGPMHSGKSRFIDSMSSALMRKITHKAEGYGACGGRSDCPNTEMFQMYKVGDKKSNVYFGDTPGFETTGGITKEDILSIVEGNVPKKFSFKDATPNVQLGKGDKIYCVCVVFDCKSVDAGLPTEVKTTIQTVLKSLSQKNIPCIAILTKGDEESENTQFDKLLVFESKHVKRCMTALKTEFHFNLNEIFPVINYIDENNVDDGGDKLLLDALSKILELVRDDLDGTEEKVSN